MSITITVPNTTLTGLMLADPILSGTVTLPSGATMANTLTAFTFAGVTGTAAAGGSITLAGGTGGATNNAGGAAAFRGGTGAGTGAGGAATFAGGVSGAGATGNGGAATFRGGAAGSTNGNGGAATLGGGAATGTGTGGATTITSGASAGASGTAGAITIDTGAANGGTGAGVTIAGTNATSLTVGNASGVYVNRSTSRAAAQTTPTAETGTSGTLTAAKLLTGIVTWVQTGAVTATLDTGTNMDAIFSGAAANDAVDWTVINTGSSSGAVTVTAASGHTIVGNAVVAIGTSATFRSRKTGSATWVTYRLNG